MFDDSIQSEYTSSSQIWNSKTSSISMLLSSEVCAVIISDQINGNESSDNFN